MAVPVDSIWFLEAAAGRQESIVAIRKWIRRLARTIRRDEQGALSLEAVLLIGAIAIPVLIGFMKWGYPKVKTYFMDGINDLEVQTDNVQNDEATR